MPTRGRGLGATIRRGITNAGNAVRNAVRRVTGRGGAAGGARTGKS